MQGVGNLPRVRQRFGQRHRSLANALGQRLAFHELENQPVDVVPILEAIDRADVWMIQRRQQARFSLEACAPARIRGKDVRQDLDRDVAFELGVSRAIDVAHSPGAEQRADLVGTQALAGDDALRHREPRAQDIDSRHG